MPPQVYANQVKLSMAELQAEPRFPCHARAGAGSLTAASLTRADEEAAKKKLLPSRGNLGGAGTGPNCGAAQYLCCIGSIAVD